MRHLCVFSILFCLLISTGAGDKRKKVTPNQLDVVFCLDLSGSTNGLISDVRSQLWHIVNQARLLQPTPDLRIGVVGFSRPSFKKENSYVKVLCDLTGDYDRLSFELNKIRPSIEKGDQFVGAALNACIHKLSWSESHDAVKTIYIVGNGMTGSSGNEYLMACEEASERGIRINSLYVAGKVSKIKELAGWNRIATLTSGYSGEITVGFNESTYDHSIDIVRLTEATRRLNLTYIYYGGEGALNYMEFRSSDSSAHNSTIPAFLERVYYKARYLKGKNSHWDIIDYYTSSGSMPDLNRMFLPDSLKNRSDDYIFTLVKQLKDERARANSEIDFLLSGNYQAKVNQQYHKGEMADNNIFSRSVINMLIKNWSNRSLKEAEQRR